MAALRLIKCQSYLGAQYRRLRTRLRAPKAITAMAHRLARLVYRMLKYGEGYVDKGMEFYERKYRRQEIQLLQKKPASMGFQITEPPPSVVTVAQNLHALQVLRAPNTRRAENI